jgi:hypothetical protein
VPPQQIAREHRSFRVAPIECLLEVHECGVHRVCGRLADALRVGIARQPIPEKGRRQRVSTPDALAVDLDRLRVVGVLQQEPEAVRGVVASQLERATEGSRRFGLAAGLLE